MNQSGELLSAVRNIYEEVTLEGQIHMDPYIGDAFLHPSDDMLRIMGIGINPYRGRKDWDRLTSRSYPQWYKHSKDDKGKPLHFFRKAKKEMDIVAKALARPGLIFQGLRYGGIENHYFTNVVKVYLDEESGKKATDIPKATIDKHLTALPKELKVLADHNCFPHVIILFYRPSWNFLWQTFHPDHKDKCVPGIKPEHYTTCGDVNDAAYSHANLIECQVDGQPQPHTLLLVYLHHPSSKGRNRHNAGWICSQESFNNLIKRA